MFTDQNTEGFTASDLVVMNAAMSALIEDGLDENSASDMVCDAWQSDITAAEILTRVYAWRDAH